MVKLPNKKNSYCKKCKIHTNKKVYEYKSGKPTLNVQGKRRYDRKQKGFGGQTKPIFRKNAKTTKKITIKLLCEKCETYSVKNIGRLKKITIGTRQVKAE
ncbi:ribosomal protein L44 (nucleomorph) [Lotharella oceanica]|uniref:Ribosomal protein L44 n=1 Tax=Lotharella oceanica TaxID=641309 RepID=A0A060DAW2_9EUKA|nr:ribosomal protein L44 [Lotharella oceanica]